MANEINFNASINIRKGNLIESFTPGSITIDLASNKGDGGVQEICNLSVCSQGEEVITTDVAIGGLFFFRNLDETNYIEIGTQVSSVFKPFLKLLPGEYSVGRLGTATIYARANSGLVSLQYRILSP